MQHDPIADALRAPALVEAPESVHRHDPVTTHAFERIMGHPSNAEITRALTMGLAINDPERPAEAEPEADEPEADEPSKTCGVTSSTGLRVLDEDGDEILFAHHMPHDGEVEDERVYITINDEAVALTLRQAADVADYLDDVVSDDDGVAA